MTTEGIVEVGYFQDAQVERLLNLVLQLTAELNATNQRQRALEMLLERGGILPPGAVDSFAPHGPQQEVLNRSRDELLGRWLRVMTESGPHSSPLRAEWLAALAARTP